MIVKRLFAAIMCYLAGNISLMGQLSIPRLEMNRGRWEMIVDNKPFLMLAGELHNSSTGSVHHMTPIWERMAKKNLNTVLAAVSWELIEPEEGLFDFTLVDEMIKGARQANLRLVLLWFGSWKNGMSTYVPHWVKNNPKRFPLACFKGGEPLNALSTLGRNSMESDTKAISALMSHLKKIDGDRHTVIAVQLENEVGTLDVMATYAGWENRAMRDYSPLADKAFKSEVPAQLMNYLRKNKNELQPAIRTAWDAQNNKMRGTWEDIFGKSEKGKPLETLTDNIPKGEEWKHQYPYLTEEIFNAWNYATYIESLARAAKSIYPLPLFVNAWIKGDTKEPGKYPSGGPQPHVFDVWRAAAPHIDLFCPDIYATDLFDWVLERYDVKGNPVWIPETRPSSDGAARSFYAFGRYNVLCYAPFGIDGNGLMNSADPNDHAYDKSYKLLNHLTPYILKYRGTEQINGLLLDRGRTEDRIEMGKYTLSIRPHSTETAQAMVGVAAESVKLTGENVAGLLIIQENENQFLVAGVIGNMLISIYSHEKGRHSGYESIDEISFDEQGRELRHRLNGDETTFGGPVIRNGETKAFRIKMYQY